MEGLAFIKLGKYSAGVESNLIIRNIDEDPIKIVPNSTITKAK
ncbi:MAG: hypothetical protein ACTSXN_15930 [Promethearchaeota archaeon]